MISFPTIIFPTEIFLRVFNVFIATLQKVNSKMELKNEKCKNLKIGKKKISGTKNDRGLDPKRFNLKKS